MPGLIWPASSLFWGFLAKEATKLNYFTVCGGSIADSVTFLSCHLCHIDLDPHFFALAGGYLIQTCRTIFKSVMPSMIFSMPSILRVRMPVSTAAENISATRARSWMSFLISSSAISNS